MARWPVTLQRGWEGMAIGMRVPGPCLLNCVFLPIGLAQSPLAGLRK